MHRAALRGSINALKFEGGRRMSSSVREMLAEANAAVPRLSPAEVRDMIGKGNVLIVDVRDAPELAAGGKLKGAVNASRGMLEFRADPKSPSCGLAAKGRPGICPGSPQFDTPAEGIAAIVPSARALCLGRDDRGSTDEFARHRDTEALKLGGSRVKGCAPDQASRYEQPGYEKPKSSRR